MLVQKDVQVQRGFLGYDWVLLTQMRDSASKLLALSLSTYWLRVRIFMKLLLSLLLAKGSLIELLTSVRFLSLLPIQGVGETLDWRHFI